MKVFGNVDKTKDEHLNISYSLEEKKAKRKDNTPLHLSLKMGEQQGMLCHVPRIPASSAEVGRKEPHPR